MRPERVAPVLSLRREHRRLHRRQRHSNERDYPAPAIGTCAPRGRGRIELRLWRRRLGVPRRLENDGIDAIALLRTSAHHHGRWILAPAAHVRRGIWLCEGAGL